MSSLNQNSVVDDRASRNIENNTEIYAAMLKVHAEHSATRPKNTNSQYVNKQKIFIV
jgi:hypothetical protein